MNAGINNITFTDFDYLFLEKSYIWLNDEEIRHLMHSKLVDRDAQLLWYDALKSRNDYKIWGVLADDQPIGCCGLKHIIQNQAEYFGYIGEKEFWGRGIGMEMINQAELEAKKMNLKTLYLYVRPFNVRAISLYRKKGFVQAETVGGRVRFYKNIENEKIVLIK